MTVACSKITEKASRVLCAFLRYKITKRGYETTFCLTEVQGKKYSGQNYQDKSTGTQEEKNRMLHPHIFGVGVWRERSLVFVCFLIRTLVLLYWGPTLSISFNLNQPP